MYMRTQVEKLILTEEALKAEARSLQASALVAHEHDPVCILKVCRNRGEDLLSAGCLISQPAEYGKICGSGLELRPTSIS